MPHPMLSEMASLVNETLGELCTYTDYDGNTTETHVTFDRNNEVRTEFGVLAGYSVVASVLKADIPQFDNGDTITDPDGKVWRVDGLTKESTAKWYFDVVSH